MKISKEQRKHCKILADEIHIKLWVQFQGGHLIDFCVDEPEKPAWKVLRFIVVTLKTQPTFVARSMFSLNADFLFDEIFHLMKITPDATGIVYLIVCYNLKCNQNMIFAKSWYSKLLFAAASINWWKIW